MTSTVMVVQKHHSRLKFIISYPFSYKKCQRSRSINFEGDISGRRQANFYQSVLLENFSALFFVQKWSNYKMENASFCSRRYKRAIVAQAMKGTLHPRSSTFSIIPFHLQPFRKPFRRSLCSQTLETG